MIRLSIAQKIILDHLKEGVEVYIYRCPKTGGSKVSGVPRMQRKPIYALVKKGLVCRDGEKSTVGANYFILTEQGKEL